MDVSTARGAATADVPAIPEAELLRRIHRRFVPLHASLSGMIDVTDDARHRLLAEIGAMLREIEAVPRVRELVEREAAGDELLDRIGRPA